MDTKQFISAIKQISEEKGIPEASVLETIEAAIAAAYKRDYGKKGQIVKAKLDVETGKLDMTQIFCVVDGVDEDGFITGPLPLKVAEDKQDIHEFERKHKRGERSEVKPEEIEEIKEDGEFVDLIISAPDNLQKYLARKGAVAVNGVSLTIAEDFGDRFRVSLITHTKEVTNFKNIKRGDAVNLEIDMLARYLEKLIKQ